MKLTKLCHREFKRQKFIFVSNVKEITFAKQKHKNSFWMLLRASKKEVSFAKIRVSTPRCLRSPFGGPHLPTLLRRRRLWMVPQVKTPDQKLVNNTSVNGDQTFEYFIIILYFPRLNCLFPKKNCFRARK